MTNAEYWVSIFNSNNTPEELRKIAGLIDPEQSLNLKLWRRQLQNLTESRKEDDSSDAHWMNSDVRSALRQMQAHMTQRLKELDMEDNNEDYITLLPTVNTSRALVVIQHYDRANDTWVQKKCSDALSTRAAHALAESWAAAMKLEIR